MAATPGGPRSTRTSTRSRACPAGQRRTGSGSSVRTRSNFLDWTRSPRGRAVRSLVTAGTVWANSAACNDDRRRATSCVAGGSSLQADVTVSLLAIEGRHRWTLPDIRFNSLSRRDLKPFGPRTRILLSRAVVTLVCYLPLAIPRGAEVPGITTRQGGDGLFRGLGISPDPVS